MMRFGITTMAQDPPARFREIVEAADNGGCDHLWVCDSSLHARDVYAYLTLAASYSERLKLGPNCTHPYTRHPAINLNAMMTVHEISNGRAVIAVAAGDRPVMELGYRVARVAVVREMIELIRALQAGGPVSIDGPAFKLADASLSFTTDTPMPVYMAASGPRMLQLAAELTDGVMFLSGANIPCIKYALEQIETGARKGGRTPDDLEVVCTVYGSLTDDVELARAECKPMAAWFPQTAPQYAEIAGVPPETIENIKKAYSGGHFDHAKGALNYVTDDMIDAFTIAGPADIWIERLSEIKAAGLKHINVFLLTKDKVGMAQRFVRDVLPALRED